MCALGADDGERQGDVLRGGRAGDGRGGEHGAARAAVVQHGRAPGPPGSGGGCMLRVAVLAAAWFGVKQQQVLFPPRWPSWA